MPIRSTLVLKCELNRLSRAIGRRTSNSTVMARRLEASGVLSSGIDSCKAIISATINTRHASARRITTFVHISANLLFDGDALGQIAGLIDIAASLHGDVVRE